MTAASLAAEFKSHPPLRPLAGVSARAKTEGPARFVDPKKGDDGAEGSEAKPWKTINHAMTQLVAGETLYLRGGSYYENVYCAVAGTPEKPITIRSYPGELATIDGGLAEFQTDPAAAWEPVADGVPGEYRSTAVHRNIRDVVGLLGDSNVGLQTYWYRRDLQAENELWVNDPEQFIKPMYCGPGLWYDKQTGRVHVRLAHTKLQVPETAPEQIVQYQGETDARKLPLVVAPLDSIPLTVSQAMHVKFEGLVFRGGGYITVKMLFGVDVTFDRCNIYCGTYGIWSKSTGPLKMVNCGVYGMIAPWMWRSENVLYAYSPTVAPPFIDQNVASEIQGSTKPQPVRPARHIARLPTHAVLVTEGGYEFETFYYPHNHHWDVYRCEFTDGHDGVYASGREIRFHHNLIDNIQDDGIYISSPTPYFSDNVFVYQNLVRRAVCGFGGHARGGPGGTLYCYRNVIDMRHPLRFGRPSPEKPAGDMPTGHAAWLVHNPDHIIHMENIHFYHNTTISPMGHVFGAYTSGMPFGFHADSKRRVFNNLCVYFGGAKQYPVPWGYKRDTGDIALDGNLHWHSDPAVKVPEAAAYFKTSREHPLSELNKSHYPDGFDAHSVVGDPKFESFSTDRLKGLDLRLKPESPAIGAGVAIPAEWPDPLRGDSATKPDIGAIPAGGEPLRVGIGGRITAGDAP
jgi:hypothetical protein